MVKAVTVVKVDAAGAWDDAVLVDALNVRDDACGVLNACAFFASVPYYRSWTLSHLQIRPRWTT